MWDVFKTPAEQVALYGTLAGQVWYLCVFMFRLIVVASIGGQVYSDEQSAFRCSTKVTGCDNVCYDKFAKISHIRFWSFQLLALATPAVIFYFYTVYVQAEIEKLKMLKEKAEEEERSAAAQDRWEGVLSKLQSGKLTQRLQRKERRIGKVKQKEVYDKSKMQEITMTRGIHAAYFCSVIGRIVVEIVFLFLAYDLFRFAEYPDSSDDGRIVSDGRRVESIFDLFWIRVPQLYRCGGQSVRWACFQHLLPGNDEAYVPCWVSRPWEKTIFLRYMNTLSVFCLLLSIGELIHLGVREAFKFTKKRSATSNGGLSSKRAGSEQTEIFYPTDAVYNETKPRLESSPLKPALSTPTIASSISKKQEPAQLVPPPTSEPQTLVQKRIDQAPPAHQVLQRSAPSRALPSTDPKQMEVPIQDQHPHPDVAERREHVPGKKRWMQAQEKIKQRKKSSSTRFLIPTGTQSLNRPKKMMKTRYVPLYKMGKISFSEDSDGGDSGGDDDESGSGSDETQRESVSQPSDDGDMV